MAAQYWQLAEIASNPEIKQRMLDMAAHYQAKADEDKDAEQYRGGGGLLVHAPALRCGKGHTRIRADQGRSWPAPESRSIKVR
jgi:hypothetical protein